jgi:hypothetical protein
MHRRPNVCQHIHTVLVTTVRVGILYFEKSNVCSISEKHPRLWIIRREKHRWFFWAQSLDQIENCPMMMIGDLGSLHTLIATDKTLHFGGFHELLITTKLRLSQFGGF